MEGRSIAPEPHVTDSAKATLRETRVVLLAELEYHRVELRHADELNNRMGQLTWLVAGGFVAFGLSDRRAVALLPMALLIIAGVTTWLWTTFNHRGATIALLLERLGAHFDDDPFADSKKYEENINDAVGWRRNQGMFALALAGLSAWGVGAAHDLGRGWLVATVIGYIVAWVFVAANWLESRRAPIKRETGSRKRPRTRDRVTTSEDRPVP